MVIPLLKSCGGSLVKVLNLQQQVNVKGTQY